MAGGRPVRLHMNDSVADGIEEFEPGLTARLMEGYADVEVSPNGYCSKCGVEIRHHDIHIEWHRNFTLGLNFATYKSAITFGLLDTIMTNVAESGLTLDELVAAAYKAREK